jgi:xylose isomerase
LIAADILEKSDYKERRKARYESYDSGKGKEFEEGSLTLEDLREHALAVGEPAPISGKQEYFENLVNRFI